MQTSESLPAGTLETAGYIRLHIAPFDQELSSIVLSSAVLPKARNLSYHSIATFPEKRYGFVELPVEDAAKIKKKLNGAVLRGVKISVEEARPLHVHEPLGATAMADEKVSKKDKKHKDESKKRKRDAEQIAGVELEEGRKVKRGWTVSSESKPKKDKVKRDKHEKDKKKSKREVKSKYTDHEEALIKTVLPPNAPLATATGSKRKKGNLREVVIHEFENTTKFPTFLKSSGLAPSTANAAVEFVDGKGWVDEEGNVVEAVKTRVTRGAKKPETREHEAAASDDETEGSGSNDSEDDEDLPVSKTAANGHTPAAGTRSKKSDKIADQSTSPPSGLSTGAMEPPALPKAEQTRPKSSGSGKGLTIKIPPSPATPSTARIHPLEALYKRPRNEDGTPAQAAVAGSKSFNFFGGDDTDDHDHTIGSQVPMTPFTEQDFASRGVRSAAPTPDTAHPSRMVRLWPRDDPEDDIEELEEELEEAQRRDHDDEESADEHGLDEEEEQNKSEDGDQSAQSSAPGPGQQTSEFQKWFWEHRGDINRSWRKRRKVAAKEKRYRDNRARAERAI